MNQPRKVCVWAIVIMFFMLAQVSFAMAVHSAGKVIATDGQVTAIDQDKNIRPIKRGDTFFVEDTIATASQSHVSLQFSDGTLLELKENSLYKIKEYRFDKNAANNDSYLAELIKGGFRTITGIVGKRNPDRYAVMARTTTLTVRGTKLMMDLSPENSVQVGVIEGSVIVTAEGNSQDIQAEHSALIDSAGKITVANFIPSNMMNGYSSHDINHLIQQAHDLQSNQGTNEQSEYIEGEGKQKPKKTVGVPAGQSPCEGISEMSGAR